MNRHRLAPIATLIVLLVAAAALPRVTGQEVTRDTPQPKVISLHYHLDQLGAAYDCYFTIETTWEEGETTRWMESYKLERTPKKGDLSLELESLGRGVPNFSYTVDPRNPKIIHVIDARLALQKEYGLESVLKSIDFSGTLPNPVNAISQRGVPVSIGGAVFTSDYRPVDYITEVHIKGEGINVRDALTNFLTLEGRGRVLWIARTKLGQQESRIQFYGPAKKP